MPAITLSNLKLPTNSQNVSKSCAFFLFFIVHFEFKVVNEKIIGQIAQKSL